MVKDIAIVAVCLILIVGVKAWWDSYQSAKIVPIVNYDECVGAGYPVVSVSPPQCKTPDGRVFVEQEPVGTNFGAGDKLVTYYCQDKKYINATFHLPGDTTVDLKLSDGRALSIPHAMSGSGARYANADETFVFWNKGNTAFITEGKNAVTTYTGCASQ